MPNECDPHVAHESFERWLGYAAMADELGFDWVSVSEHHSSPLILVPSTGPLAGALTRIVQRARIALLGPLVSINNPVRVAEEIAMLDQLSQGRLIVLLLRGTPSEFKAYEPVDAALTQPKTQAATRLVRKALTDTTPFAWKDEFFDYPNIAIWPRPLQQPLPPMYFSGNSLNSAEFAAQERLGLCISFHRPEAVANIVAHYRTEARRCGWEPTSVADQSQINSTLQSVAGHVAYTVDLGSPGFNAASAAAFEPVTSVPGTALAFWAPTAGVTVSPDVTASGAPAVDVSVPSGRSTYAAVQHTFASPQDWSHRADVFVHFDGTNSGLTYQVVVTFNKGAGDAYYAVKDDAAGWRTIALSTDNPAVADSPDWAAVTGIRIALPSKALSSSFRISGVALSGALTSIAESYPTPYAAPGAQVQVLSARSGVDCELAASNSVAALSGGALTIDLPANMVGDGCRAVVLPSTGIHALPVVIPKTVTGSSYQATFTSSHAGVLVFDQGYDPGWLLSANGTTSNSHPGAVGRERIPAPGWSPFAHARLLRQHRRSSDSGSRCSCSLPCARSCG